MSGAAPERFVLDADVGTGLARMVSRHARDRPGRVLAMVALALVLAGLALVPPVVVARLVDAAIEGRGSREAALGAVAALVALALADGLATYARRRLAIANELEVRGTAVAAQFRASLRLPLSAYAMGRDVALVRSFDDLDTVVEFVAARSVELFAEVAIVAAYVGLMLWVEPVLAGVFAGLAGLGMLVSARLSDAARRACDAWLPVRDSRFGMIVEFLTAMLTIKALNAHALVARPFGLEQAREQAGLRGWRIGTARADAVARLFAVATPGVGAAVGVLLLVEGRLSAGDLLLFLSAAAGLGAALAALHGLLQELAQARASLARMRALRMGAAEALAEAPVAEVAPGALAAEAVGFRHPGAARDTLDAVALRLRPGSHVAIVGRSGEGKTTLALLLARMFEPDRGAVAVAGTALPAGPHRDHVVLVGNTTTVFSASVRENVRLWDAAVDDAAVWRALGQASLRRLVEDWADGLDAPLGSHGNPLSAGQQQRLGLARAMLRRPAVLILDEATGAMDATTEAEVMAALRTHMAGRAMVVITHREAVAAGFDRVLRMEGGRLVDT